MIADSYALQNANILYFSLRTSPYITVQSESSLQALQASHNTYTQSVTGVATWCLHHSEAYAHFEFKHSAAYKWRRSGAVGAPSALRRVPSVQRRPCSW